MPLTLNDASTGLVYEIVYVTAISGVTLTVQRAQEGTTAQNWNIGDFAFCAPTAGTVATALGNSANTFQVAPAATSNQAVQFSQLTGLVGAMRNASMNVATASASATFTADQIVVGTALNGLEYLLPSYSHAINLAATGAGGMDTGSAPISGYVALYAIYNPTSGTASILATNATSSAAPTIYGGANMPAGYTASALISAWPTNSSGQLVVGIQIDRSISILLKTVLSTSTAQASWTSLSIASAVPPNARSIRGATNFTNNTVSTSTNGSIYIASNSSGAGEQFNQGILNTGQLVQNYSVDLSTSQTIFYQTGDTGSVSFTANIYVSGYTL